MDIYKKLKKQISMALIAILTLSLAAQPVLANENTKKNVEYIEIDGQQYEVERIKEQDGKKITNNMYLDGKFIKDVVVDFGKEIITSNGKEVGFVKEVLEEVGSVKEDTIEQPNNMITSVVDPGGGGGGIKTYIRTYSTGFYSTSRDVVLLTMGTIASAVIVAIAAYYGLKLKEGFINTVLGIFIANKLSDIVPEKIYYVKTYDTGIVNVGGANYRRALLDVYSDSSCSWDTYMGCEWADAYIVQ